MSVPQNKQQLLDAIDRTFSKLIVDLAKIPADRTLHKQMDGHASGTLMSVSNLVAYLVGWNELVLKWLEKDAAGEEIDFPESGYKWNELGKLAQKFYVDYEGLNYPHLLERLQQAKSLIVMMLEATDDDALYGVPWYGKWTKGRMIQFNTSSPYDNARKRLRAWAKEQSVSL